MPRFRSACRDAPTELQYRELKRSARERVPERFQETSTFAIYLMGELGLRAGELAHIQKSWVDFSQCEIQIPSYSRCTKGKEGTICGYCRKQAFQRVEHDDELTIEEAFKMQWRPKLRDSTRTLYYGWNPELIEIIDRFFYTHDEYPNSRVSVNRRVNRVAEHALGITPDEIYPHALRGRAAIYHTRAGLGAYQLKDMMGWADVDGAEPYVRLVNGDVKSRLKELHGAATV